MKRTKRPCSHCPRSLVCLPTLGKPFSQSPFQNIVNGIFSKQANITCHYFTEHGWKTVEFTIPRNPLKLKFEPVATIKVD